MLNGYKVIAICIAKIRDVIHSEYINAISDVFKKNGYRIFIYHMCTDMFWETQNENGESKIFEIIDYDIIDGMIIFDQTIAENDFIKKIHDEAINKIPVIHIDAKFDGGISVMFDYRQAVIDMVNHIVKVHKIKDLHFMGGCKNNYVADERLDAFKSALAENDIPFDDDMVSYGEFWSEPTQKEMEKIISSGKIPGAIICANDIMAVTVCDELKKQCIKIPEDVIVTGFDGLNEAKYALPSITTCECPYDELSELLLEIFDDIFAGKEIKKINKVSYRLKKAQSCGCIKENKSNAALLINEYSDRIGSFEEYERRLHELNSKIQSCDCINDITMLMHNTVFKDVCFLLNTNYLDFTKNPMDVDLFADFTDEMYVLYDSRSDLVKENKYIKRREIMPEINECMNRGVPIIFSSLNILSRPLGYVCFFSEIDLDSYIHITQLIYSMDNALTGFANQKYQKYINEKLDEYYKYDPLTKLLNRNGLEKSMGNFMQKLKEAPKKNVLTVVTDLDGLKIINDTFGHEEGDKAIAIVAEAINHIDAEYKLCARTGGDEMLALLLTDIDENITTRIKNGINSYLDEYNQQENRLYKVSVSIGFSICSTTEFDTDKMQKFADREMYRDKYNKKKLKK